MIEEAKHKEQMRQIEKDKRLKREELEAKKKIKEQIEADKRARKEKAEALAKMQAVYSCCAQIKSLQFRTSVFREMEQFENE